MASMQQTTNEPDRLSWFAGNEAVLDLYLRIARIAHLWDDIVDGDKPVSATEFLVNTMLRIPANPAYAKFGAELRTLMFTGAAGYLAANELERTREEHALEIAHYLRYAIVNVGVFLIAAMNGIDKAGPIIAAAMPHMIPERLDDYIRQHAKE